MWEDQHVLNKDGNWTKFHPVVSLLSYILEAPLVPKGAPVMNVLFAQRDAVVNIMKAWLGYFAELQSLQKIQKMVANVDSNEMEKSVAQWIEAHKH